MSSKITRGRALLAPLALLLLAGCGSDGGGGPGAKAVVTFSDPSGGTITLKAPKTVPAGSVEVTVKNTGNRLHGVQLVRVEGKRSAGEVVSKVLTSKDGAPTPDWAFAAGGVSSVAPGASKATTLILRPGTYFIADDGDAAGLNYAVGGIAQLEVTGSADGGKLPDTDATIVAKENSFATDGLKAGENRVTFENAGQELHQVFAVPVAKGSTFAQVKQALTSDTPPSGPPPFDEKKLVRTSVLEGGSSEVTTLQLQAGTYAFADFTSDRAGGPSHAAKGMITEVKIK